VVTPLARKLLPGLPRDTAAMLSPVVTWRATDAGIQVADQPTVHKVRVVLCRRKRRREEGDLPENYSKQPIENTGEGVRGN
jgi:hypothetical protein